MKSTRMTLSPNHSAITFDQRGKTTIYLPDDKPHNTDNNVGLMNLMVCVAILNDPELFKQGMDKYSQMIAEMRKGDKE